MESVASYSQNVRYQLAKQQLEQQFLKWISTSDVNIFVHSLVDEINNPSEKILKPPAPIFINKIAAPMSPSSKNSNSGLGLSQTIGHTPPRSPSAADKYKTLVNPVFEPIEKDEEEKDLAARTLTRSELNKVTQKAKIPKFYHEGGKPLPLDVIEQNNKIIDEAYGTKTELTIDEFMPIVEKLFKISKIFKSMCFNKFDTTNSGTVSKDRLIELWESEYARLEVSKRLFKVITKPDSGAITIEDFKPIMRTLLDTHPGLEFLQATPEFQDRYADTVIMRIFFVIDTNDDGWISYRDFKKSNLMQTLKEVDEEDDINKIRDYFSYEHFYVLYCRFWELDSDHDFFIDKEDFSRYEGYALSRKTMDRIFDKVPRHFKSTTPGKMWYEDFVWFMLWEEDKTTKRSLEYWFKIVDLDSNGIITPHEMEYFYEEQVQRLESLNHEPILFTDLLCQMNDMIWPENEVNFTLDELLKYSSTVGIFFNWLCNLNKFIAYETRDLFAIKHQLNELPDYSEWDRFAKTEYERLAMEEENPEDSDVLDTMDQMNDMNNNDDNNDQGESDD
jgi:serine/threonine-protein phosphatase 2A regulatory subunit B''